MQKALKRFIAVSIAIALILLMSGCLQLKEIREFSELAGDVGSRFPVLAHDLHTSCMSQQRYIVAQKENFRFDKFGDLFDDNNRAMAPGRLVCKNYDDEEERLIAANATLVAYMKTLSDLAADDLTNFDKNIEAFGQASTQAKLFTASESTAITNLAKFLSRAATEGYRRKKLRDAIKQENSDVQQVIRALSRIVKNNYALQLEDERVAMTFYYRKLVTQTLSAQKLRSDSVKSALTLARPRSVDASLRERLEDPNGYVNPAPLDDLKGKYEERNAAITLKVTGASAYLKILTQISKGHQNLYDNVDKLSSKEVLSATLSYAKTIKGLVSDFQKAF